MFDSKQVRSELLSRFGIDTTSWYPLAEALPGVRTLAFHTDFWEQRDGDALIRRALHQREVHSCYVIRECFPPDAEVEVDDVSFEYRGMECYVTSKGADWVVYASHESSITVAGAWLLDFLKREWPGCELNTYRGPFGTIDLRGSDIPRELYRLKKDLSGADYVHLMRFAVEACKSCSLVVRHSPNIAQGGRLLLDRLSEWLLASSETDQWPDTRLFGNTATIYKFAMNFEVADLLTAEADHVYGWLQPELPEDFCLYREDDTLFLATAAHEQHGFFTLTAEELKILRSRIPTLKISLNPCSDGAEATV